MRIKSYKENKVVLLRATESPQELIGLAANITMKKNFNNIEYEIVIIEQDNDLPFNKGLLFNSGFLLTSGNTDYYALHDIDELPISANYSYTDTPMHICVNIYEQNNNGTIINEYKESGFQHNGGSVIINKEKYIKVNGHSNLFWGKCRVDINFRWRCLWAGVSMHRYKSSSSTENDNGFYISLKSKTVVTNQKEIDLGILTYDKTKSQEIPWQEEGLNTIKYILKDKIVEKDFIKYKIDFNYDDFKI